MNNEFYIIQMEGREVSPDTEEEEGDEEELPPPPAAAGQGGAPPGACALIDQDIGSRA